MRHLCLAVVPFERVRRLRELEPSSYDWVATTTWADAIDAIRTRPVEVGMIDPLVHGESAVDDVEQLRVQFPSLPLILYTTLSPATASVLLRLGRVGVRRVVFARFEDAPGNLRRAIARELEHTALQQAIRSLDHLFARLPDALRSALEASLHTAHMMGDRANLDRLAAEAHLTRQECQAWFARAGLPVPRVVLVLTRLLYAHRLLLDPGHTVDDVARKLGYAKTRTLQAHLRMAFGMTAGELRETLAPDAAVALLMRRYFDARMESSGMGDLLLAQG